MAEEIEKSSVPQPSHEKGQRSVSVGDLFLTRFTPPWARPSSLPAYTWRAWVLNQPVALVCRETLIANLEALDWKITPRDMRYKDELSATIHYYTRLLQRGGNFPELGLDYTGLLEWVIGDMLDTPFGGFCEVGRRGDAENGRVVWLRPVDAGTLYPTLNRDYPVVQYYQGYDVIAFPRHAQARVMWSPHPYLFREGWGIAPPEKIYLALDLLNRGDKYYANLLLDIPTAGILDLGDMERETAEEWIQSFKTFINDNTVSFKVPVLYEHNTSVNFIPFGRVPNDLMFDRITLKYAALVAAAYGMSLSDIGLQTTTAAGETLAGSIRQERRTKRTGFARVKAKWKSFVESFLPPALQFVLIDYDDELNVAMGRARLASATAMNIWREMGAFTAQEMRSQALQDGLISITIPERIEDAEGRRNRKEMTAGHIPTRPGLLGSPTPPSRGGEGEVRERSYSFRVRGGNLPLLVSEIGEQVRFFAEFLDERDLLHSLAHLVRDPSDPLALREVIRKTCVPPLSFRGAGRDTAEEFLDFLVGKIALSFALAIERNELDGFGEESYDKIVEEISADVEQNIKQLVDEFFDERSKQE